MVGNMSIFFGFPQFHGVRTVYVGFFLSITLFPSLHFSISHMVYIYIYGVFVVVVVVAGYSDEETDGKSTFKLKFTSAHLL